MPSHVHIGGMSFVILGFEILLWMALFRVLEMLMHGNSFGRALAFVH